MRHQRWQLVKALFAEALSGPAANRAAVIAERCGGDAELCRDVESLLRHAEETSGALARNPRSDISSPLPIVPFSADNAQPGIPERIGSYQPIRVLGQGGMGIVY